MKITATNTVNFVKNLPPNVRFVLLHGPDEGLIRSLTTQIKTSFLGSKHASNRDLVTEVEASSIKQDEDKLSEIILSANMFAPIPLKVVIINGCSAQITPTIKGVLPSLDENTLLILRSAELPGYNSLKNLAEQAPNGASIGCYHENKASLEKFIRTQLQSNNFTLEPKALQWLKDRLGNDRQITASELDKLMTYMGSNHHIEEHHVLKVIGSNQDINLGEIVKYILAGQPKLLAPLLREFLADNSYIVLVRSTSNTLRKILSGKILMTTANLTPSSAVRQMKPPVMFNQVEFFNEQLTRWNLPLIHKYLKVLVNLELNIKKFPNLAEVFISKLALDIAAAFKKRALTY